MVFAQGNIPRLEELKPGYEDHSETAQRIDLDRACRSNLEEEKARTSAPEVQSKKSWICEQSREVCARRRKTSTTEWFGARSLSAILDRWGPPHIEPEAEPPERIYWLDVNCGATVTSLLARVRLDSLLGLQSLVVVMLKMNLRSSFIGMMAVTTVSSVLASIRLDSLLGDHGSQNWKRVFESALDAIIIDQVSDKGSNMLPAMKDVAVRLSSIANTVNDIGPCSIHIVQTITNTVNEVRDQVGRMHCFGNIARQASFFIANCHAVEYLSEQVVRIPMGPPEEANDLELLKEILYDLSGGLASTYNRRRRAVQAFVLAQRPDKFDISPAHPSFWTAIRIGRTGAAGAPMLEARRWRLL